MTFTRLTGINIIFSLGKYREDHHASLHTEFVRQTQTFLERPVFLGGNTLFQVLHRQFTPSRLVGHHIVAGRHYP